MSLNKSFPEVFTPIGVVGTLQLMVSQCAAIYKQPDLTFSFEF